MPVLKILVGMIASGKSTFAATEAAGGAVVINDDALVTALHGGDYRLYTTALKPLYKSTENHIAAVALALRRNVIVDRGLNVSERARKRGLGLASSLGAECEAVVFDRCSPETHAHRRSIHDNRGQPYEHWLAAAMRHDREWITPTLLEGFSTITWHPSDWKVER